MNQTHKSRRRHLVEKPGGNPVVGRGQTPLERHHLADAGLGGVAGRPGLIADMIGVGHIGRHIAGREAVLHRQGVEIGFDGRTNLTSALPCHIVLEVSVVGAADISLHMARVGVHTDKTRAQETFIILQRVQWRHQRIHLTVRCIDRHFRGDAEAEFNILLTIARMTHDGPTGALTDGALKVALRLLCGHVVGIRAVLQRRLLTGKNRLQSLHNMLLHRLFGIGLHAGIHRGIDLQTVGVDVVVIAVGVHVFVTPTVERIRLPGQRVFEEFLRLPRCVVAARRPLGHEHTTQIFTQIGAVTLAVVHTVKIQDKVFLLEGIMSRLSDVAALEHLVEHHIAALAAALRHTDGIEQRGILAHAHQDSTFVHREIAGLLAEIGASGRLDAHGVVKEIEVVEIHCDDFLLGVIALELQGNHPLDGLLEQTLEGAPGSGTVELLGQLLRDGATAAGALLLEDAALDNGAQKRFEVDARMHEETLVLCSHQSIDQCGRQILVGHKDAIALGIAPGADQLAVGRKNLRGELVHGVLKLLKLGHIADIALPNSIERTAQCQPEKHQQTPQKYDNFLSHGKCTLSILPAKLRQNIEIAKKTTLYKCTTLNFFVPLHSHQEKQPQWRTEVW